MSKNSTPLDPLIKWSGGKRSELDVLRPLYPQNFDRVIEPFAGGAAVSFDANPQQILLNDVEPGLVAFYQCFKDQKLKKSFLSWLKTFNDVRLTINTHIDALPDQSVADLYQALQSPLQSPLQSSSSTTSPSKAKQTKNKSLKSKSTTSKTKNPITNQTSNQIFSDEDLAAVLEGFLSFLRPRLAALPSSLSNDIRKDIHASLRSKIITRLPNLEKKAKVTFSPAQNKEHLRTALHAGLYTTWRRVYNNAYPGIEKGLECAAWYLVRSLCYSGMFRYGKNNLFNVPYGGMAYNDRDFSSVIDLFKSSPVQSFFDKTAITKMDFEAFFKSVSWRPSDFLFVDPPYDSAFSKYNRDGDFTSSDQERLAKELGKIKSPWMVVVKNTPLMQKLYQKPGLTCALFSKSYQVNFRNRNDPDVDHLIVTNYPIDTTLVPDQRVRLMSQSSNKSSNQSSNQVSSKKLAGTNKENTKKEKTPTTNPAPKKKKTNQK